MGTAIVSTALDLDGEHRAAGLLLVIAAALAVVLALRLLLSASRNPRLLAREASMPAALTAVAAACVVGTRLSQVGWPAAGGALLGCAVVAWPPLLYAVLRRWRRPVRGDAFLASVATQAIAVLCAQLGVGSLAVVVPALTGGLALYVFAAASFDLAELRRGLGDQWVAGGALAISALAAATAAHAERGGIGELLRTVSVALWVLALAWLPALVAGELLVPRVGFDARRWSTVFPIGMYAATTHAVGQAAGREAIIGFARVWTWVAVAVWAAVALGSVRRAGRLLRSVGPPRAPQR